MTDRKRSIIVVLVLALTLVIASAPYLYGYWIRPPGTRFWAVAMVNYYDANQYLGLARSAVPGQVLLGDPFTGEPHAPRLFLPHVQAEAALCRWTGCSVLTAFHVSRVVCGALLLAAGWWLGTLLLTDWRRRWLYLALLCFSAGAGWLVDRAGYGRNNGDAWQPEGNTFHTLNNLPHLSLSAALLTFLFASLVVQVSAANTSEAADAGPRRRHHLLLSTTVALAACLLAFTHPFDLITYAGAITLYAGAVTVLDRKPPRVVNRHVVAVGIGALPAAAYLGWVLTTDPFYRSLADDPTTVQSLGYYLVAHGLLLVPALVVAANGEARRRYLVPLCWVGFAALILLLPFRLGGKQPRLLGGVHVPLALLATLGIDLLASAAAARMPVRCRSLAWPALCAVWVVATASGAWGILERHCEWYRPRHPDFYQSAALTGMFDHLAESSSPEALALGGLYTGGWAPALASARVYCGHWQMTLDEPRKRRELDRFYTKREKPSTKANWLRRNKISWVIWYPWEWGNDGVSPANVPGLTPAYVTNEVSLFRFQPLPEKPQNPEPEGERSR